MYKAGMIKHQHIAPEFLRLAGHPLRWRIMCELGKSDRVVSELTALLGESQNLVSYHLGKLRQGSLVFARRSSADGRDSYYSLDLPKVADLLSAVGGSLHHGLHLVPAREKTPGTMKVLFLCTGNSARSQMAEAMVRAMSGGSVDVHSAGSDPKPLHANAVRVMRDEYQLDISCQVSKHLNIFAHQHFDCVVSLCDKVREICPEFFGSQKLIHWSIPNPATAEADQETYPQFSKTAADLATRIQFFINGPVNRYAN